MPVRAKKQPISARNSAKTVKNSPKNGENITKPITENNPLHYSISALSRKFVLDRATVRDRLEKAEIKPVSERAKEKLYRLEDVEDALSQDELEAAKLQKLQAEAKLKEHDLQIKRAEFASVAEFTEIVQKVFGRLHKKLAVQMPGRIALRLHNANSSADVNALLKAEIAKEFDALRNDFKKYL